MVDISAIEQTAEKSAEREISGNIAEDFIEYCRGNVVANEQQFLLSQLQYGTAWLHQKSRYTNSILIGPTAGGKTQVQKVGTPLLPSDVTYTATELTGSAAQDDNIEWNTSLLAPLDEIDKIGDTVREFLKSMAGEDGGATKKRSVSDDDSETGRSTVTMKNHAMPYQVLYAPEGDKAHIPSELDNRLLKIYVDDNKHIREAIGRKEAGHQHITVHGLDNEYIYDTSPLRAALRRHYRDLPIEVTERTEGGKPAVRRGGMYAKLPEWVWYSVNPIFDFANTSTNRFFGMVFNLMRSSAGLNYHNRRKVEKKVNGVSKNAYLVTPQDVANVLLCQETLLGTTHSLNPRKRAILDAVNDLDGINGAGCTLRQVKEHLESSDQSVPTKQTLRRILEEELAEGFYIKVRKGEGPNNATLYEFRDSGTIEPPRLFNLQDYAERDGIELDGYGDVDPQDPFAGTHDPIRDQPFKETVEQFSDEMSGNAIERTKKQATAVASTDNGTEAASYMGEASTDDSSGQATLADATPDYDDDGDEDESTFDTHVEEAVFEAVKENCGTDGKVFSADDPPLNDYHVAGIVDEMTPVSEASLSDTMLDPIHELWDHPSRDDDWVTTEGDAKREVTDAWESLISKGLILKDADTPDGFIGFMVTDIE
jgi:hypothetical protein